MKTKQDFLEKYAKIELGILKENGFYTANIERAMDKYAEFNAIMLEFESWKDPEEKPIHTSFVIADGLDYDGFETREICYYDQNYGWCEKSGREFKPTRWMGIPD